MQLDVRHNPALLKLDLYCKGMRIDDSCLVEQDGGRKILRTRAGLEQNLASFASAAFPSTCSQKRPNSRSFWMLRNTVLPSPARNGP